MSRGRPPKVVPEDPGGALVVVCVGPRCSGRRALAGGRDQVADLQRAVRSSRGAVLVTADCLGGCSRAAVAGVAHRDGGSGGAGTTVWLTGLHEPARADALAGWVRAGGPAADGDPDTNLPVALIEAVAALGPPPRIARRRA